MKKLTLSLWDTCPTQLHCAGLGGLWFVLKSLSNVKEKKVNWEISPNKDEITLSWSCSDSEAITWLLSKAYQLTEEGIIKIPANGNLTALKEIAIHNGITSVFYRQPRVIKSKKKTEKALDIDGKLIKVKYKPLEYYPHQDLKFLKPYKKEQFKPHIPIVNWVYPGGGNLHEALGKQTKLKETPEKLIALAFAPIACSYYKIQSHFKGKKLLWALVIPDVENLEDFAEKKQKEICNFNYLDHISCSLFDACFKFASEVNTTLKNQVWSFGFTDWSPQQLTITGKHYGFEDRGLEILDIYRICDESFPNILVKTNDKTFITTSSSREVIIENIAEGKKFYHNFHRLENKIFDKMSFESSNLLKMKEKFISYSQGTN